MIHCILENRLEQFASNQHRDRLIGLSQHLRKKVPQIMFPIIFTSHDFSTREVCQNLNSTIADKIYTFWQNSSITSFRKELLPDLDNTLESYFNYYSTFFSRMV